MKRAWGFVALVGLSGCVSADNLAREQTHGAQFDAAAFFTGRTEGKGTLKVVLRRAERTLVVGVGSMRTDRTIVLDQTVRRGNHAATCRQWVLHPNGPDRYVGTLSDAVGPVVGMVSGNRLQLAFAMKGGLEARQWLYLERGGAVARNVMIVSKLGLPVARLDETITRKSN
ncbi:DUF3833 family protein [Sphingomonas sp. GB1N7]|uniref:DUF3833 family protein n=1 Tax=Parasphingomonas caseinilytica TaxID=3096158 RepID=UPI002FC91F5C